MLRKFYKLCRVPRTTGIHNIRTFSRSLLLRQSDAGTSPVMTFHEDDAEEPEIPEEVVEKPKEIRGPPLISCRRKEFDFYKGPVFKKFDDIPIASAGWHHIKSKGDSFTIQPDLVEDESAKALKNIGFKDLGLGREAQKRMKDLGFSEPTNIQKQAIPEILAGQNTIIQAETGTGKTFAYLLPMIDQILRWKPLLNRKLNSPLALILVPSRELVLQIGTEATILSKGLDIDIKTLIGGRTKNIMRNPSIKNVDILIGTVGMTSKLTTTRIYMLDEVRHTVLDEAHALFDESYDEKLSIFLRRINFGFKQIGHKNDTPGSSQLTMASATMPDKIPNYFADFMMVNSIVPIQTQNVHRVLVPQKFCRLGADQKPPALLKIVRSRASAKKGTIIFSNSTQTADWISIFLNRMNIKAVSITGDHNADIRREKYWDFRNGRVHILSTTNSAGRGLDTVTVDCVINYDFPMSLADYIHRCGRTGRVGSKNPGKVINFICRPLEIELTKKIERAVRRGRILPLFDIHEQTVEKKCDAELRELLGKVPKEGEEWREK